MFGKKINNSVKLIGGMMLFVLLSSFTAQAQDNVQFTQGKVEEGMSNSMSVPLMNYQGRGIDLPVTLNYSSNVWRIDNINTVLNTQFSAYQTMTQAIYSEHATSGWRSSLDLPKIEFPKSTDTYNSSGNEYCYPCASGATQYRISRLFVHLPDGSTHELRESDTPYTGSIDMSGTFYAVDGSRLRYDSTDADTGTLYLPDGTRYILDAGSAQLIDRNGNTLNYNGTNRQWTDTLGRVINMPFPASPQAQDYTYNLPGLAGVNNGLQSYTFKFKNLADALTPDANNNTPALRYTASHYLPYPASTPTDNNGNNFPQTQSTQYQSLFQTGAAEGAEVLTMVVGKGQSQSQLFNPVVLAEIVLPNGTSYKFSYNVYGEIDKIIYPTGAYEKYQIEEITGSYNLSVPYNQANRGVTNRKLSVDGTGNNLLEWKYSKAEVGMGSWGNGSQGADVYKAVAPDKTRTEVYKLKIPAPIHGSPLYREFWEFGFIDARNGAAVEKRVYSTTDGGFTGGTMLRRELTEYESTAIYQTTPISGNVYYAFRNIRPIKNVSLLFEGSGSALAQTSTYTYDTTYQMTTGIDQTQAATYQYAVISNSSSTDTAQNGNISQISAGSLARYSETTYLNDSTYRNANILGLPTIIKVKDSAGTILAQSEMVYDESGYSPAVGRGLPTSSKVWDSTKGIVTNSSAYLTTRATFDTYGNRTIATDAMDNSTTTTFDATYHAFPISVTTAAPDQNGGTHGSTTGFTTSITYDSSTPPLGLPVSMTDINGQTSTIEYNDALLRPTKTIAPNGQQTITEYGAGTSESTRFVKVKTQIDASHWSEAITWYDQIGRTYKSEKIDSGGNIFTETEYDDVGRVKRSTNPYRTGETKQWTTPTYDTLGRATTVTLPGSSTIQTAYGLSTSGTIGTTKQITDQAGKQRKGITDALGRMVRVIEDPGSLNLATDYVFDLLGNLRKTTQDTQIRYFSYDSLGRLLRAKQVEQDVNTALALPAADAITGNNEWSVKYVYDDNGNITSTTDAKNITVTASYDHLNRIILRDYSDSTADVSFYYDGKYLNINDVAQTASGSAKGKITGIKSSVSRTNYTSFDSSGRLLTHQQITDGQTYPTSYTYNLSGAVLEETYSSGRVVKNTLNQDGELAQVQSKKSNTGFWTYASGFDYNSAGAATKMRLGNGHWETYAYNSRLQITQIGLGATDAQTNFLKLEYDYGTATQNNGSLREQKITVPTVGGSAGFTAIQSYEYDSLNRLQWATETVSSTQSWKQTFQYDRYGNRRFNTDNNNTTTLGTCSQAVCNPLINTSDNRFSSGQNYSYDANGNVIRDAQSKKFTYDAENHQTKVETVDSNGNPISTNGEYLYDGNGKRVKKITNLETTVFVYNASGQLVAEYSSQTPQTPQVSYLTTDHLGSARVITDQNGAVTTRKDYLAFGDEASSAQRTANPNYDSSEIRKGYTGYEKDGESGLEFAQARYYNAGHGRFTSVDPLTASATIRNPQTFNRYSYVLNSPYKYTDPLGLIPQGTREGYCGAEYSSCSDNYIDYDALTPTVPHTKNPAPPPSSQPQNPTNPYAPVPGPGDVTTPNFSGLLSLRKEGNASASAALTILENTCQDAAEVCYSLMPNYYKAVFLNTVDAIVDATIDVTDTILVSFYYPGKDDKNPSGITLSNITKEDLNKAGITKTGGDLVGVIVRPFMGRRSPSEIKIASLEATINGNNVSFDVDLFNPRSSYSNFKKHRKEISFNKNGITTHPADVARALSARGVKTLVTTK